MGSRSATSSLIGRVTDKFHERNRLSAVGALLSASAGRMALAAADVVALQADADDHPMAVMHLAEVDEYFQRLLVDRASLEVGADRTIASKSWAGDFFALPDGWGAAAPTQPFGLWTEDSDGSAYLIGFGTEVFEDDWDNGSMHTAFDAETDVEDSE